MSDTGERACHERDIEWLVIPYRLFKLYSLLAYSFVTLLFVTRLWTQFFWLCCRYRENAKRLSKAFKDRPASPLETAIWWIEYVARGNGLPYVRSEAVTMPWHERYLADVHAVLLLLSLLALYAQYRLVKYAFACVPSRSGNVGGSGSGKRRASLPSKKRD